jgi:hypothetical protein
MQMTSGAWATFEDMQNAIVIPDVLRNVNRASTRKHREGRCLRSGQERLSGAEPVGAGTARRMQLVQLSLVSSRPTYPRGIIKGCNDRSCYFTVTLNDTSGRPYVGADAAIVAEPATPWAINRAIPKEVVDPSGILMYCGMI